VFLTLNFSSLSLPELEARLESPGIYFQAGAFVIHVQTRIPAVAEAMARVYADYPILAQTDFADFHVGLVRPATPRRWFKPQVLFRFDDKCPFKPLPLEQAFPMFEWGLNWCVASLAHRYLIIHAAVVEKEGFAAVLPAPPGSGKSTLCAALVNRGWRLLSDELALIRADDGKIVPFPRPVSLKNESIDIIGDYVSDGVLSRKILDTTKGTVAHLKPPVDSVVRANEVAQPAWVIFPRYEPGSAARLSSLPRSRTFMRVAENAFNYSSLGGRGFDTLAKLIDASLCYDFTYSVLDEAIETFSALNRTAAAA
jgi:hypothetical protein